MPNELQVSPLSEQTLFLKRVARIRASMDLEPGRSSDILDANGLSEEEWEVVEDGVDEQLDAPQSDDGQPRQTHFDEAYVARVEEERGAITFEEYARLVVGEERGRIGATLDELELVEAALPHIGRVLLGRTSKNAESRRRFREALELSRSDGEQDVREPS